MYNFQYSMQKLQYNVIKESIHTQHNVASISIEIQCVAVLFEDNVWFIICLFVCLFVNLQYMHVCICMHKMLEWFIGNNFRFECESLEDDSMFYGKKHFRMLGQLTSSCCCWRSYHYYWLFNKYLHKCAQCISHHSKLFAPT